MNLIALSAAKILSYPYLLRSASLSVLHFRQTDARIFVHFYLADSVLRDPLKKGTTLLLAVKSLQNLSSNPGGREKCGSDIYGNLTQISPPKSPETLISSAFLPRISIVAKPPGRSGHFRFSRLRASPATRQPKKSKIFEIFLSGCCLR